MARIVVSGFENLEKTMLKMAYPPERLVTDALTEMAEVGKRALRRTGEEMEVRDRDSSVHILDKIKVKKIVKTRSGGFTELYFSGTRKRGNTVTSNGLIAFENEYGNRHQRPRPFVRMTVVRYGDQIAEPGEKIIGDWIEKTFNGG